MSSLEDFPVQEAVKSTWAGPVISWMVRLVATVRALADGSGVVFSSGNRAMISNSIGALAESEVTSVELGYLDGVTSNVQTQINGKVDAATITALTDSSGGTADDTIAAIPDPGDTPASADALRDDLVTNTLPAVRNAVADLAAKVNALIAAVAP